MWTLAALGAGTIYFLLRFWPMTPLRRIGVISAIVLCLLEIGFNA